MKFQPMKTTLIGLALSLSIAGAAMPVLAAQNEGTYVTQENDTFWTISQKLHVDLNHLLAANSTINPLNVYGGLTLKVPYTQMTTAAVKGTTQILSASTFQHSVQTVSGKSLAYSKVITGVATAYSEASEENGGWGAVDYFGNPLHIGTIAVDPKVIPLGTKVYITGYTFDGLPKGLVATASDAGGAINGNRVDIFIPSSMDTSKFGIQNVQIYVLK